MVRRLRFAQFWKMVDRQVVKESNLAVKAWLDSKGFVSRLSFYGKLLPDQDRLGVFRRIELLAGRELRASDVSYLYSWFSLNPPKDEYTIWAYVDGNIVEVRKK